MTQEIGKQQDDQGMGDAARSPVGEQGAEHRSAAGLPRGALTADQLIQQQHSRDATVTGAQLRPAQGGGSTATDAAKVSAANVERMPRLRDRVLWIWPVAGICVTALVGELAGPFGALLTALVMTTGLLVFVGEGILSVRVRLISSLVAILLAAALVVAHLDRVAPFFTCVSHCSTIPASPHHSSEPQPSASSSR